MYRPRILLRCNVFLVSEVLNPRTIRQSYSCSTGRAISLTKYTVMLVRPSLKLCFQTPVNTAHLSSGACTCYEHGQGLTSTCGDITRHFEIPWVNNEELAPITRVQSLVCQYTWIVRGPSFWDAPKWYGVVDGVTHNWHRT
jgi:hypothetical protein